MLTRKTEVNYRRAEERCKRCKCCAHKEWMVLQNATVPDISGVTLPSIRVWRCNIIGLQSPRKYGIQDDHVCDRFESNGGLHD